MAETLASGRHPLRQSDGTPPFSPASALYAYEHALIGMAMFDVHGRLIRANPAYCALLGYAADELQEVDLYDIVHAEDAARDVRQRAALLAGTMDSYRCDKRYIRRDGRLVWGDFCCTLVRDAAGVPQYFIGQVQDITERKRAETALRESEDSFRRLCDLSSDWYWVQDAQHRLVHLQSNARTPESLRERLPAVLGRARWEVRGLRPLRGTWDDHRAMLDAQLPFREFECGYLDRPDGVILSISGEPRYVDGRFAGYFGTTRDVTAKRRAQEVVARLNGELEHKVRARTRELQQANAELEAMAYSIAHDLRAPMTSLAGYARLLEQNIPERNGRNGHFLRRLMANVQSMADLTDGLLALAHLSAVEPAREPVDLGALVHDCARALQEPGRSVALTVEEGLLVDGDPALLRQLLAQLVGNAFKFSRPVPHPAVAFGRCRTPDGEEAFCLRDNGVGFDPAAAGKLFTAFQRLHAPGEFEGTGIGLAIARKIVQRHGGRIGATASPGEGASIWFTVPAAGSGTPATAAPGT